MSSGRARSFGANGAEYHRLRPHYPTGTVDWMLPGAPLRVLDLGAGTGILTDALVARGIEVVAIDPDPAMLEVLAERHPDVTTLVGTAEDTGLTSASIDAVVVGQAWHWMDPVTAGAELARVLRPGGSLAMAWNSQVSEQALVKAMSVVQSAPRGRDLAARGGPPAPFAPLEVQAWEWVRKLATQDFIAEWTTHSTWLTADAEEQAERMAHWQSLAADLPERVAVSYRTEAWRTRRA